MSEGEFEKKGEFLRFCEECTNHPKKAKRGPVMTHQVNIEIPGNLWPSSLTGDLPLTIDLTKKVVDA